VLPRCRPIWQAEAAGSNFAIMAVIIAVLKLTASSGVSHSCDGAGSVAVLGSARA
jgi:hypothetical protein